MHGVILCAMPDRLPRSGWTRLARRATLAAIMSGTLVWVPGGASGQGEPTATLVRVIDTSRWSPPSTDPTGITYLPGKGRLLVSDSEVEETGAFEGVNVFRMTRQGMVRRVFDFTSFTIEPAGMAAKPRNRRVLFISDDDRDRVFILRAGPDRRFGTTDDRVEEVRTRQFGSWDPEGVSFGRRSLFVADGSAAQVFRLGPGPNGRFDGVPPQGDDQVLAVIETVPFGLRDPEGVDFDRGTGHLFIVSRRDRIISEVTLAGELVHAYDISGSGILHPSGVAVVRNPRDTTTPRVYVTDRGIDNVDDPNENDGKIYVFELG